jgi:DNA-binding XRE family transcriptional regulator
MLHSLPVTRRASAGGGLRAPGHGALGTRPFEADVGDPRPLTPIIKDLVVCAQEDESHAVATVRDGIPKTAHHRESATFRRTALQLGHRVREMRQELGWTVEEAAEKFGIEPAHVRRIEAGRTNPSLATLVSIAHALGKDVTNLLARAR